MLLNFRVANHRSIREEQELQLHPVYDADRPSGTNWEAVPVAGVFGANAAGKSNLIDALMFMARMVVGSHRDAEPDGGVPRRPFRLDEEAGGDPSWYVVDLLLDGVRYTYGFSIDDDRVLDEWLYCYPHGRRRKIFQRMPDEVEPGDSQSERELRLVESITEPNVLFMSVAARSKQAAFRPVYDWFVRGLQFRRLASGQRRNALEALRLLEAPESHPGFMELLRSADLGIEEVGTQRVPVDAGDAQGTRYAPEALFALPEDRGRREMIQPWIGHRGRSGVVRMELKDQSAGTRALLEQAPRFLSVLREGGTFVVDEIDSSLHPLLTARLIGLFQSAETNPRRAQLVFTTHDASLLGRIDGEDILKRDQVWFVEKNQYGETELFSLAEFKPRQEENRERRYLGGSYGGVPFIDDSFARALSTRGDTNGEDTEADRPQVPLF
ncbi:ATP-binding protein [Streptomyces sp. SL13]|uniref:ATP-binding protein n=1 Tax=Streptantibioticus silvisoli TaxID=2705255 RepID=A0AA90KEZ8_9ACTN|nr:ATP-binding protein [Streptantibioticus silvisoli]MDI5962738.1 ATP-binding protein [Streptantibioticus silvisoli]MDI5968339.1 ATP-binding protein [Streptantibioticus silvisoli]